MTISKRLVQDLAHLVTVCHWGAHFYGAAAEASQGRSQCHALQTLGLQRVFLAEELLKWVGPTCWEGGELTPLVLGARRNDPRILQLCDHIDRETIAAYTRSLKRMPDGAVSSMLVQQLRGLARGWERRQLLEIPPADGQHKGVKKDAY